MLDEDKQKVYIRWIRQAAARSAVCEEMYEHAWKVAADAAQLLRERFGVNRVRVFGSLTDKSRFHPGSDIDLAVDGLEPADYWDALAAVLFIDKNMTVEMVDKSSCRPEIWKVVEHEGIDL